MGGSSWIFLRRTGSQTPCAYNFIDAILSAGVKLDSAFAASRFVAVAT